MVLKAEARGHEVAGATSIKQCGTVRGAVVGEREKLTGKDKGKEAEMTALEKNIHSQ